jgi:hypothetical protein
MLRFAGQSLKQFLTTDEIAELQFNSKDPQFLFVVQVFLLVFQIDFRIRMTGYCADDTNLKRF